MPEDPASWPLCCGSFTIPAGHPCLPGHFPGNPLIPGVVLLDQALVLVRLACPGRRLESLRLVRFREPVRPAQAIAVHARPARGQPTQSELVDFAGLRAGMIVFSGSVCLSLL